LALLPRVRVVVALGRIGFNAYLDHLKRRGVIVSKAPYPFAHEALYHTPDGRTLIASYHPSNQNTNTGRLTEAMFTRVFERAARELEERGA
ncbi:MAG: uracil-DNA glycosylase family protein, partial [Polyangiales bacterium]